jgi:hypothetical protein
MKKEQPQDYLNAHLESVTERMPTTVEVAKTILGEGAKGKEHVEITLRREVLPRIRAESPARAHVFHCLDGFMRYLDTHGREILVLASPQSGQMSAVLDEGSQDGYEIVHYGPASHPLWLPWLRQIEGQKILTLKELAVFLISNRKIIVRPNPESLVEQLKQIQVGKQITMHEGIGAQSVRGFTCVTRIQGKDSNQLAELPERLVVETPLFFDGEPLPIEVDLLFAAEEEGVAVTLASADAEYKRVLALQGLLDKVEAHLPQAVVGMGAINHENWQYVA